MVNLESLSLDLQASGNNLESSPDSLFLRSSIDGYANTVESVISATLEFDNYTIDLSEANFQNVAESITFRMYVFGAQENSSSSLRHDNLTVSGTLVLEEAPSWGTVIMISSVSGWLLLTAGLLLWKEIFRSRGSNKEDQ